MTGNRIRQTEFDLDNPNESRAALDKIIEEARLYQTSKEYKELLKLVSTLRNLAPFNAMLLHVQKPGLTYAATAAEWRKRFNRFPKPDARPLLIMWPFGPVALVYDVLDTDGEALPPGVEMFPVLGEIKKETIGNLVGAMSAKGVSVLWFDGGDAKAGSIERKRDSKDPKTYSAYTIKLNKNHPPATLFVTIAHELAHLFLGHIGADLRLRIAHRPTHNKAQREIEAESIAYLVAARSGLESESQSYLSGFVDPLPPLDIYTITRAAGQVEHFLGLPLRAEDTPKR